MAWVVLSLGSGGPRGGAPTSGRYRDTRKWTVVILKRFLEIATRLTPVTQRGRRTKKDRPKAVFGVQRKGCLTRAPCLLPGELIGADIFAMALTRVVFMHMSNHTSLTLMLALCFHDLRRMS